MNVTTEDECPYPPCMVYVTTTSSNELEMDVINPGVPLTLGRFVVSVTTRGSRRPSPGRVKITVAGFGDGCDEVITSVVEVDGSKGE